MNYFILYKLETRLVKHLHENLPKEPIFPYFCKYLAYFRSKKSYHKILQKVVLSSTNFYWILSNHNELPRYIALKLQFFYRQKLMHSSTVSSLDRQTAHYPLLTIPPMRDPDSRYATQDIKNTSTVPTTETGEGWLLLTVETEVNEDSKSTN